MQAQSTTVLKTTTARKHASTKTASTLGLATTCTEVTEADNFLYFGRIFAIKRPNLKHFNYSDLHTASQRITKINDH